MKNTRNVTNVESAYAPQSGSGLDIRSIPYEFNQANQWWFLLRNTVFHVTGILVS